MKMKAQKVPNTKLKTFLKQKPEEFYHQILAPS